MNGIFLIAGATGDTGRCTTERRAWRGVPMRALVQRDDEHAERLLSIVKFHYGHFDGTGTSNVRSDFTNQCQSVGSDQKTP
jgi:hypothetical protein